MKIVVASSAPPDSGAGISTYTRSLAVSLIDRGDEVHYVSPAPADKSWLEQHGIAHFCTDQYLDPLESAQRLLHYIQEQGIDGVINNDNPIVQSIAPGLEVPLLVVCHMDSKVVARLCALHMDWIDHLVCISNDMLNVMISRYRFPVTRCSIVYNGMLDPGHSGNYAQHEPGILRLVFSGGWNRNKGARSVLEGLLSAPDIWDRIRLDWFGTVPPAVQARATQIPTVTFRGHVPRAELGETLALADCLLFASKREGCPMSIMEAMSFGVVPISSDGFGAMRWLTESGRDGFICNLPRWPEQMAECIRHLSDHPVLLEGMKRNVRTRFLRDFTSATNAENMIDLLGRPTVDRKKRPERFKVIRWHRPMAPPGQRNTIARRIRYRAGWLQDAGEIRATKAGTAATTKSAKRTDPPLGTS